jgi:hypothetical protein
MYPLRLKTLLAMLCMSLVFRPSSAVAWDDAGHRLVAQIASDESKRKHPGSTLLDDFWSQDPRKRTLYLASIWPDVLKAESPQGAVIDAIQHVPINGLWHYVDVPFDANDKERDTTIEHGGVQGDPQKASSANVVTAIRYFTKLVKDLRGKADAESRQQRADAVSWLIHLAGDIHQPLHCVTVVHALDGYDPSTLGFKDRGGNGMKVRWPVPAWKDYQNNLHSFWDDQFDLAEALADSDVPKVAAQIEAAHPAAEFGDLRKVADPATWARESFAEHAKAYGTKYDKVPTEEFRVYVKQTAEKRVALAGYRLADLLETLLGP